MSKVDAVLGRGISALISEMTETEPALHENVAEPTEYQKLPIGMIYANPHQPRKIFEEAEIEELKTSILQHGVLQPIVVRQVGAQNYQLIAGERRLRASKIANLHEMPAIIKNMSDREAFEVSIIENVQRQALSPIEEAVALKEAIDKYNYTQAEIATKIAKSRSYVANAIRLLNLPQHVLNLIALKKLTMGHAKILVNAENPSEAAKEIVAEDMSVRDAEKRYTRTRKAARAPAVALQDDKNKDPDIIALEDDLSSKINAKVTVNINHEAENGSLSIEFSSLQSLDNIIQMMYMGPPKIKNHNTDL